MRLCGRYRSRGITRFSNPFTLLVIISTVGILSICWSGYDLLDSATIYVNSLNELLQNDNNWHPNSAFAQSVKKIQMRDVFVLGNGGSKVGLGNKLFRYASMYGIANMNNMRPSVLRDDEIVTVFTNLTATYLSKALFNRGNFTYVTAHNCCTYDPIMENLPNQNTSVGQMNLHSFRYFHHVRKEILTQFQFSTEIVSQAHASIRKAAKERGLSLRVANIKVGVHVRRGDFSALKSYNYGRRISNFDYINRAMTYFREKYENVLFLVTSNDLQWCTENMSGPDIVFMDGNEATVDLCILAHSDHVIMTVGTFGWWGGYLCEGTVIYDANSTVPGSAFASRMRITDRYPPEWISM